MRERKREREREGGREEQEGVLEKAGPGSCGAISPLGAAGNGCSTEGASALPIEPLEYTVLTEYVLERERERERERE